jgi:hypothetical protein
MNHTSHPGCVEVVSYDFLSRSISSSTYSSAFPYGHALPHIRIPADAVLDSVANTSTAVGFVPLTVSIQYHSDYYNVEPETRTHVNDSITEDPGDVCDSNDSSA